MMNRINGEHHYAVRFLHPLTSIWFWSVFRNDNTFVDRCSDDLQEAKNIVSNRDQEASYFMEIGEQQREQRQQRVNEDAQNSKAANEILAETATDVATTLRDVPIELVNRVRQQPEDTANTVKRTNKETYYNEGGTMPKLDYANACYPFSKRDAAIANAARQEALQELDLFVQTEDSTRKEGLIWAATLLGEEADEHDKLAKTRGPNDCEAELMEFAAKRLRDMANEFELLAE